MRVMDMQILSTLGQPKCMALVKGMKLVKQAAESSTQQLQEAAKKVASSKVDVDDAGAVDHMEQQLKVLSIGSLGLKRSRGLSILCSVYMVQVGQYAWAEKLHSWPPNIWGNY